MITLYGIKNCDTVKKARRWLQARGIEHRWHDFRADGLDPALLADWADRLGWERLLNRSGTTYRRLPPERTAGLNRERALALMLEQPTLIKRPVAARGGELRLGFREADWQTWLDTAA
jgi:arsenate reductase